MNSALLSNGIITPLAMWEEHDGYLSREPLAVSMSKRREARMFDYTPAVGGTEQTPDEDAEVLREID